MVISIAILVNACDGEGGSSNDFFSGNFTDRFVNVFVEPIKDSVLANATVLGVDAIETSNDRIQTNHFQTLGLDEVDFSDNATKQAFYGLVDRKRSELINCNFISENYNLYNFSNSSAFSISFDIPAFISAEYNYFDTFRHYCEALDLGLVKGVGVLADVPEGEQVLEDNSSDVFKYIYDTFTSNDVKYGRFKFFSVEKQRPWSGIAGSTGLFNTRGSQTAALALGGQQENNKSKLSILHNVVLYPAGVPALFTNTLESKHVNNATTTRMFQKLSIVGMNKDGGFTLTGSRARFYDRGPVYEFGDFAADSAFSKNQACKTDNQQENYRKQAALGFYLKSRVIDNTPYLDTYCRARSDNNKKWLGDADAGFMPYENYFVSIEDGEYSLIMKVNCMADATENAKVANLPPCVITETDHTGDALATKPRYQVGGQFIFSLYRNTVELAHCHYGNKNKETPIMLCEREGINDLNKQTNTIAVNLVNDAMRLYNRLYVFELAVDPASIKSIMNTELNPHFDPQVFYENALFDRESGSSGDYCDLANAPLVTIPDADTFYNELLKEDKDNKRNTCQKYVLTADINLGNTKNIFPIGSKDNPFEGSFNGNGFTISNLDISIDTHRVGLFGYIENKNSVVKNFTLQGAKITGKAAVGAVVGHLDGGSVYGIHLVDSTITATGTIKDEEVGYTHREELRTELTNEHTYLGGIAGVVHNENDVLLYAVDVSSDVTVKATAHLAGYIGGIVGAAIGGQVSVTLSGAFHGSVESEQFSTHIGGIAGIAVNAHVKGANTGIVSSKLTNENYDFISDGNQANNVADTFYVGGLVGGAYSSKIIGINTYSARVGNIGNGMGTAGIAGFASESYIYGVNEGTVYGSIGATGLTNALTPSNIQGYNLGDIYVASFQRDDQDEIPSSLLSMFWQVAGEPRSSAYGIANFLIAPSSIVSGYSAGRIFNQPKAIKEHFVDCGSTHSTNEFSNVYCFARQDYSTDNNIIPYAYFVHTNSSNTPPTTNSETINKLAYFSDADSTDAIGGFTDTSGNAVILDATGDDAPALHFVDENSAEELTFVGITDGLIGGFLENDQGTNGKTVNPFPRLYFPPSYPYHGMLPNAKMATSPDDGGVYPLGLDNPPPDFVLPKNLTQ